MAFLNLSRDFDQPNRSSPPAGLSSHGVAREPFARGQRTITMSVVTWRPGSRPGPRRFDGTCREVCNADARPALGYARRDPDQPLDPAGARRATLDRVFRPRG